METFQSTRPVRGATGSGDLYPRLAGVSIHAPRAGRDLYLTDKMPKGKFQSTRPVRGATPVMASRSVLPYVSIHAPRAGRDAPPV